jgi:lipid-A-disaccharide synthase
MKALKEADPDAQFRFFGGDLMSAVGGTRVKHYKELAYMGFIPVLLHLRTIMSNMSRCKKDIIEWKPDVLILVDYPGFNLSIAEHIHKNSDIPVYYYISPKIWAWKEHRIKNIKRDIDKMFSILPFEVEFYKKHNYEIDYVGNPCVDAVAAYQENYNETREEFLASSGLPNKQIVALLAGSRKQEIESNLPMMLDAIEKYPDHLPVIAKAPGIDREYYSQFLQGRKATLFEGTYRLLMHSHAALVTSGTATLETALFRVPQVVCYATPLPKLYSWLRKKFLKVKYVSLVNLIADKEVVTELVADTMRPSYLDEELKKLLEHNSEYRNKMFEEYDRIIGILGSARASRSAAEAIYNTLKAPSK